MAFTKPVLAGNWKLNHGLSETRSFLEAFREAYPARDDRTVVLFPPALSVAVAREQLQDRDDILLGVQNVHWEGQGAFTGEVSAQMAAEAGARLCLVGHSERRQLFGETSEQTALKVRAVLAAGLAPLLCVGETLEEREADRAVEVVYEQLRAVYDELSEDQASEVLIAYEPVWAIGTGKTASPADAEHMHGRIRAFLAERLGNEAAQEIPLLYGGSVKPGNVQELLTAGDVDGVLVGGASLQADSFATICQATT